jgi:hypothetical protein
MVRSGSFKKFPCPVGKIVWVSPELTPQHPHESGRIARILMLG